MPCFLTRTASFLPGRPVENDEIESFLGSLAGEEEVRERVLAMNGIVRRHYAQDADQNPTYDVFDLGTAAIRGLKLNEDPARVTQLAAGTTFAPLAAPGFASILHSRASAEQLLAHPLEIGSYAGICSSAATALVGAIRAVADGYHQNSVCVAAEHSSEVLKSSVIQPVDDRAAHENLRDSRWFMSVFLRFMLSDGAGAVLLQNRPHPSDLSLRVNWTFARSFADRAPLCMKMESRTALLSQDLSVLSRYLFPSADAFLKDALRTNSDSLDSYAMILPHMSSFFFRRKMERVIAENCQDDHGVPYWTNLATVGNTGAASIFVMLDHYLKTAQLNHDDRILMFVPESGQFNFVLISLTAVRP